MSYSSCCRSRNTLARWVSVLSSRLIASEGQQCANVWHAKALRVGACLTHLHLDNTTCTNCLLIYSRTDEWYGRGSITLANQEEAQPNGHTFRTHALHMLNISAKALMLSILRFLSNSFQYIWLSSLIQGPRCIPIVSLGCLCCLSIDTASIIVIAFCPSFIASGSSG